MHELTAKEKMILDMAARPYKYQGARETDIRKLLDLTPTSYYQQLNHLIDRQEAVAYAPMVVKQLQGRRRR
jgi:hypothetical protein